MTHINNIWAASPYPGMQRARLDVDLPTRPALSSKVEVVVAGTDLQNAVVGAALGVIERGNHADQVKQEGRDRSQGIRPYAASGKA